MNHPEKPVSLVSTKDVKLRILSAAHECIKKHGSSKTTIGKIANESHLSRPTIYKYFKNKDEIIFEIGIMLVKQTNAEVHSSVIDIHDPINKIIEALLVSITSVYENEDALRVYQDKGLANILRIRETSPEYMEQLYLERWGGIIEEAQEKAVIRTDTSIKDMLIWLYFIEFAVVMRLRELPTPPAKMRQFIKKFVVEGLMWRS